MLKGVVQGQSRQALMSWRWLECITPTRSVSEEHRTEPSMNMATLGLKSRLKIQSPNRELSGSG